MEEHFALFTGGQLCVQTMYKAGPRLRRMRQKGQGALTSMPADGTLLETCTWEMMRADRGTWDARVGLSELMRDSIFSASLLQASIWERRIRFLKSTTTEPVFEKLK